VTTKRSTIYNFSDALDGAEPRPAPDASQSAKKNYAERLSRHTSTLFANRLRDVFPSILPTELGLFQESRARSAKGVKKLDVNYSTTELGLGLGVSIKTLNFRDPTTNRYTKNYTRIDNELRAEAMDYHTRQPFAVLVGVVFLPADACGDGSEKDGTSSFGAAVQSFRPRGGRRSPTDDHELFESVYIGLYEYEGEHRGSVEFFDVATAPTKRGRPKVGLFSLDDLVRRIIAEYDARNSPPFQWADE
jgi:hypothetical protein